MWENHPINNSEVFYLNYTYYAFEKMKISQTSNGEVRGKYKIVTGHQAKYLTERRKG
jgi:hypothetical protein